MSKLNFRKSVGVLFALSIICASCSKSDDADPNFPNKVDINFQKPGEENISFDANYPWSITSDKDWCKFKLETETEAKAIINGNVGKQTIVIHVDESIWSVEKDLEAEVKMTMQGQTKLIAKVKLLQRSFEASITSGEITYSSENPIQMNWNDQGVNVTKIKIDKINTNFDWVISTPNWIKSVELSGESGTSSFSEIYLEYNDELGYMRESKVDNISFKDKDGSQRLNIPISYEGIRRDVVKFGEKAQDGYVFSFTGENYKFGEEITEGAIKFEVFANPTISLRPGYFMQGESGLELISDELNWLHMIIPSSSNKWIASLTADANEEKKLRNGIVVLVPGYVYTTELGSNFSNILDGSAIKPEYSRYVAFNVSQEAKEDPAFKAEDLNGKEYIIEESRGNYSLTISPDDIPEELHIILKGYRAAELYYTTNGIRGTPTLWAGGEIETDGYVLKIKNFAQAWSNASTRDPIQLSIYTDSAHTKLFLGKMMIFKGR